MRKRKAARRRLERGVGRWGRWHQPGRLPLRHSDRALFRVDSAGADFAGWLPNFKMPTVFARHAVTAHVPRQPFANALPGAPTMRMFEALACGIPLVSGPWEDAEGLFAPGHDHLVARNGDDMQKHLRDVLKRI